MRINIVFDFNYLAHSEFSIFTGYSKSPVDPFGSKQKEAEFVQGLANKFFHVINALPKGGKVVCCIDSKSWRKTVHEGYKESREDKDGNKPKMDKAVKDKFYELIGEFTDLLKTTGIVVSRVPGAEGDDLMYRWSDHFYRNGDNTILVTGDHDMTQVVRGDNEPWVVVWNNNSKHNRVFAANGWKDNWLKNTPNTIFEFNVSADKDVFAKHIRDNGISVQTVNKEEVVMHKILLGDDGDDVPSVWSFNSKNKKGEDKVVRVTEKKVETIIGYIKTQYNLTDANLMSKWDDAQFIEYLSGVILRVSGDIDDADKRLKVAENLERNAKLVWLSDKTLPVNLISMMDERISAAEVPALRGKWNRKALFEGTRFDTGSGAPAKMDPFANISIPD